MGNRAEKSKHSIQGEGADSGPDFETVVIGAGPGGICAGIKLKQAGLENFQILERADDVGGSWRDNTYPGLSIDVPAFTYQYSFATNPYWDRLFPVGAEVLAYHQDVARRFDLYRHIRFGASVVREVWDDRNEWWAVHLASGDVVTARFVISAVGAYITAKEDPGIEGWEDFTGRYLRPASWDHGYDLKGKSVAVIGTGASGVQIIPSIAPDVAHLDVFQRTPAWAWPKPDFAMPWIGKQVWRIPGFTQLVTWIVSAGVDVALRLAYGTPKPLWKIGARMVDGGGRLAYRAYLAMTVRDSATRNALMPKYGIVGKRPTLSNSFLQAFNRDNVTLRTDSIARITPTGIRTADGIEHEADAIVLATGYHLFSDPESYVQGVVVGREGFDLGKFYNEERLQAYESVSVPGLPNRWMVVGPYSWIGTGWHLLVEIGAGHAVNVISEAVARRENVVEISSKAHNAYHQKILANNENILWYFNELNKGLRTYYVNSQGDSTYIRPTSLFEALRNSRNVPFGDYNFGASLTIDELFDDVTPAAGTPEDQSTANVGAK